MIARQRLWRNSAASTVDLAGRFQLESMLKRLPSGRYVRDWIEDTKLPAHRCVEYCACTHERAPYDGTLSADDQRLIDAAWAQHAAARKS